MGKKDDLFYGYKKLHSEAYKTYKPENSPLDGKYSQQIKVTESAVEIDIKHDWMEMFEEYLPYVENCIGELRSFLRRDEELINVQLANNININETLTYMTQHTDIIEDYDEAEQEVTPGKLINIFNESTYDIYENRFIYTVVNLCGTFFEELMAEIEKSLSKHYYTITTKSLREESDGRLKTLSGDECVHNLTIDKTAKEIEQMEESLPDLKRVVKLSAQVKEMFETELIQSLKGCKEVTAPLTMTNVLQKNPNFQKAVTFWDFLMTYADKKFTIKHVTSSIKPTGRLKQLILEMSNANDMIYRYGFDPNFAKNMDDSYNLRLKQEKEEALKEKKRIDSENHAKLKLAVESQANKDKIAKDEMEKKYKRVIAIFQAVSNKDLDDAIKEFNKRSDNELEDRLRFENELRNKYVTDFETLKNSFDVAYEAYKNEMEVEKNNFMIDHNNQLRAYEESHNRQLDKLNSSHTAEIHKMNADNERIKKDLIKNNKAELAAKDQTHRTEMEALIKDYEAKLEEVAKENESRVSALNDDFAIEKNSLIQDMQGDKDLIIADYEEKLTKAEYKSQKAIEENDAKHLEEIEALKKAFEEEKIQMNKDHDHEVEMVKMNLHTTYNSLDTDSKLTLSKERKEHEETLNALMDEHSTKLDEIKKNYEIEIAKYQKLAREANDKLENIESEYERKLNLQGNHYEAAIADIDAKHKREVTLLNRSYKKELDDTIENYKGREKEYFHTLDQYKATIDDNNKKSAEDLERVRLAYEAKISRQQNKYDSELDRMQSEFNTTYSDLNKKHGAELEAKAKDAANLEKELRKSNQKNASLETKIAELEFEISQNKKAYSELKKMKAKKFGIEFRDTDSEIPSDIPEDERENNNYDGEVKSYDTIMNEVEESLHESNDDTLVNEPTEPLIVEEEEPIVEDIPEPDFTEETSVEAEPEVAEEPVVEEVLPEPEPEVEEKPSKKNKKASKKSKEEPVEEAQPEEPLEEVQPEEPVVEEPILEEEPVEEPILEETPVEEVPTEENVEEAPVEEAPKSKRELKKEAKRAKKEAKHQKKEEPVDDPTEEPSIDEMPVEEVPTEDVVEETPVEDAPIIEEPIEESAPVEERVEEVLEDAPFLTDSVEEPKSEDASDDDLISSEILDQLITKAVAPEEEEIKPLSRKEQRQLKKNMK